MKTLSVLIICFLLNGCAALASLATSTLTKPASKGVTATANIGDNKKSATFQTGSTQNNSNNKGRLAGQDQNNYSLNNLDKMNVYNHAINIKLIGLILGLVVIFLIFMLLMLNKRSPGDKRLFKEFEHTIKQYNHMLLDIIDNLLSRL